nr:immunoglobulin heavy chain junction region [Macaca mulatta]
CARDVFRSGLDYW